VSAIIAISLLVTIVALAHCHGFIMGYNEGRDKAENIATSRTRKDMVPIWWGKS
jgi:hypothetical protein